VPSAELFSAVTKEVARVFSDVDPSLVASVIRFDPGPESVLVGASRTYEREPLGSRWVPKEKDLYVSTRVLRTRTSAGVDQADLEAAPGPDADVLRLRGFLYQVGSPVVVEGQLWGAMCLNSRQELPPGTAGRLESFTELVATAIANAESREAITHLADEQAALRRVATLVARDVSSTEVFEAVATEVGQLLDTDITVVGRYDGDGAATAIGSWSASGEGVPVGTRSAVGGNNVLTIVAETGRPARVEGYEDASGEAADIARRHGWRSSIAAPIIVESRLWGVMLVATQRPEPFPAGSEERLSAFTDLVATALANAQAHDEVLRFGEEQAAIGRVATLVAAGAAPEQVFKAVVDEASSLLGLKMIEFVRYDDEDTGTVIAASGDHPFPPGSTWSLDDPSVMATVARTGRAARIDDYGALDGEIARVARTASFQSAIGAPLTVEGHLWGVIIAISTDPEPIPERSEARLAQFTGLVATAVANAEARQALEAVAAEQATLRRIATLVARGAQPEEVFAAVAEETASTFQAVTAVMRFEHDPPGVILVGVSEESGLPIGTRWGFAEGMASAEVYRTGRSARLSSAAEYWTSHGGPVAEVADRLGIVSQVSCPIVVEGGVWGVITLNAREELPADTERRLEKFTDLVTTAVANAEGKSELAASRRRIVAAADDARRRIERDLHDGIQQRLVALTLRARAMAREPADELPGTAAELAEGLKDAFEELREISRGIHPAILTEAGLRPALRALARRSSVPINVDVRVDERLPAPVEAAAYYVASEALTNVAKHAHAKVVELIATRDNGDLTLEIRDDGVGGVDAGRGSGILGLTDRVEALGGTISLASPPGGGTTLSVRLPITT
jgi:signal transduction histidine kinase